MKRRLTALVLLAAVVLSFSLFGDQTVAEEASDFDSKIEQAEKIKEKARQRVKELQDDIQKLENNKGNLLKYVEKVDKKIASVSKTLKGMEKQIESSRKELAKLEEALETAEKIEEEQYEIMKKRIKYMYESGGDGYLDILFSAQSLDDILNRSEYIEKISQYDKNLFAGFAKIKEDTEKKRAIMEGKIDEITALQDEVKAEKDALKKLKSSKKKEVRKLSSAISVTDKKMQTYNAQVAKQEAEVERLLLEKQKEINRKEAQNKAANSTPSANPSNPAAGAPTYEGNASGMRWPLNIRGRISSRFGARSSPTEGASTYHQGLDIAAASGTPIVAAADGEVVTATYSSSAGNYIMLYHGNSMYTVYMHASSLAVTVGTQVKQGDVIAYVGSTGVSTGPHLHFGISVNAVYRDPLGYVTQPAA